MGGATSIGPDLDARAAGPRRIQLVSSTLDRIGGVEVPTTTDTDSLGETRFPTRPSTGVGLTVVVLAALLWWLNSSASVEVAEAEKVLERGITAIVKSCGGELGVDVYEDDSLVLIEVVDHRFRIRFSGDACQDVIRIPLSVPLGNRALVDRVTSEPVPGS